MSVRLLIVDDTDHVRRMLVEILGLHGFEVVGDAGSGEEAIRRAAADDPDVVVMDLKMPGEDGIEVVQRLRSDRPDQQVILYSAYLDAEIERRAKDAGVAACVPKLAGVEQLAREIAAVALELDPSDGG